MDTLETQELIQLIDSVFPALDQDKALAILVDFPETPQQDNVDWMQRRGIAYQWFQMLRNSSHRLQFNLFGYTNVGSNNADLPETGVFLDHLPETAQDFPENHHSFKELFTNHQLFLAPTEYSTTAPLKLAAKQYQFRAATMGGFSAKMLPALRIDYQKVNERVLLLQQKLDPATAAEVTFTVANQSYQMSFDLRFRKSHTSGGRFPKPGTAGNLPSGETYIVPYEGEQQESSLTQGILPVQFGDEVVFYEIEKNRARKVIGDGIMAQQERQKITEEPAYANIAELGFGVLGDFGLSPIDEVLLDEKLGFHIAFGRSDHFGGAVAPQDFSSPQAVVHIDRVYIPETQPKIKIQSISLKIDGQDFQLMENNRYTIF